MPVFRVEKNSNYTTMCNYHLRDQGLSLKGKGLLSMLLSLPDTWNYSVRGLSSITPDGVDGVLTALKELERLGYLERNQQRESNGRMGRAEYVIYEMPRKKPCSESPCTEKPYVTEGTFDAYLYQTLENKQKFISQIMTSKSPVRSCDDVDEQALSYAEIKALCAGDPQIKEKMDLDVDVARLKVLKADHQSQQYRLEDKLMKYFPAEIEKTQGFIKGFQSDIRTVAAHPLPEEGFCGMTVNSTRFTEKADAGEAILAVCKANQSLEPVPLGSYRGFKMELTFDSFQKEYQVLLKGEMTHRVPIGTSAAGNIQRLDNGLRHRTYHWLYP